MSRVRIHRADGNQRIIVAALRQIGVSVAITSQVGTDFPDLVWGYRQVTGLIEVKRPGEELTPGQREFRDEWRGSPVLVARAPEEAIDAVLRAVSSR